MLIEKLAEAFASFVFVNTSVRSVFGPVGFSPIQAARPPPIVWRAVCRAAIEDRGAPVKTKQHHHRALRRADEHGQ
jgi:hypothetical protein